VPLSHRQRRLNRRLRQSSSLPSGTISQPLDWNLVEHVAAQHRQRRRAAPLTEFHLVAYAVARAAALHPRFRSTLISDDVLQESPHVELGVAVHLPDDDLALAVLRQADLLSLADFAAALDERIFAAMNGDEQPHDGVRLVITYLGGLPATDAVPLLVSPATGVLFFGAPYATPEGHRAKFCLTFDHRIVNGVAAARFLDEIARQIECLAAHGANGHIDARRQGWLAEALRAASAAERSSIAERAVAISVGNALRGVPRAADAALLPLPRGEGTSVPPLPLGEGRGEGVVEQRAYRSPHAPREENLDGNHHAERDAYSTPAVPCLRVDEPLRHLGLSSLAAVELAARLSTAIGQPLPQTLVWSYPTIAAVATHLLERLELTDDQAPRDLALPTGEGCPIVPADEFDSNLLAKIERLTPRQAAELIALFHAQHANVGRPSQVVESGGWPSQAVSSVGRPSQVALSAAKEDSR
jgi:hypothetical protein